MNDRPVKPAAQRRHENQIMQQVPKPKLTLVFTLDGVTAEPLLTYKNKPAGTRFGKTTFTPSEQARGGSGDAAFRRHRERVSESVRSLLPNLERHEEAIIQTRRAKESPSGERKPNHERER